MGKRIPKSRKHKKLKFVDPCYSGDGPHTKKKKILPNEPPSEVDYQEVPRHAAELMEMKRQVKANKLKKRKKKKKIMTDDFIIVKRDRSEGDISGTTKGVRNVPNVVKQKKNETEEKFFRRLQRMADTAIAEAKIEEKYDIELVDVDKKGNAQYVSTSKEAGPKKQEKRKRQREKEVEKKKMKMDEPQYNLHKEKIDFGEVVMAPPTFTSKPRKAPEIRKPGKKSLFLNNILGENTKEEIKNPKPLSTKWKNIPSEKRKLIENERSRAVQMYRMLKSKKINS